VLAAVLPDAAPPVVAASRPAPARVALPFDYTHALDMADAWVIEAIGRVFVDDCPRQMQILGDAIEAGDHEVQLRQAHTLRGLAGQFKARRMEELAGELERHDPPLDPAEARSVYALMQVEAVALGAALEQALARSDHAGAPG
jgi:two-component system sensor histidine kinase/response regulator